MAKKPNLTDTSRIYIRPSVAVAVYLDDLARIGIHGKTRSEVANTLVGYEVERLIREKVLTIRRPRGRASV